ncbi:raqprd family integrative conjugative element protein [Pseudomonas fluorescens]|nr:raqprd family integrative conjugative element protein [Pseudomonas fluorescens]
MAKHLSLTLWMALGAYFALTAPLHAAAPLTAPATEHAHLAAMLRQLDTLERHTERSAALPSPVGARYRFDYLRLREDLQRIRSGVQDYLTPQRAQPRDPAPLVGDYTGEADAP